MTIELSSSPMPWICLVYQSLALLRRLECVWCIRYSWFDNFLGILNNEWREDDPKDQIGCVATTDAKYAFGTMADVFGSKIPKELWEMNGEKMTLNL